MDLVQRESQNRDMATTDLHSTAKPYAHAGALLREWRIARRMSQLGLALEAGVSTRHLSYVETGRSQPGRDMIGRLAVALDMPLRERNTLLVAAGYAPEYHETPLTTVEMKPVQRAIEFIINQQEPYPALVMNRHWEVLVTNRALERVFRLLREEPPRHGNIARQIFDPDDMRPFILNWEEVAGDVVRHLHNEVAAAPTDARAKTLLEELLAYPGVPAHWRNRDVAVAPVPLLTAVFGRDDLVLQFFSTYSTFGTPRDITLDELRIECMFPADEATAEICRNLAR